MWVIWTQILRREGVEALGMVAQRSARCVMVCYVMPGCVRLLCGPDAAIWVVRRLGRGFVTDIIAVACNTSFLHFLIQLN